MNICLILGLLCLVYGLIVAIAGSGGTKFFIVWNLYKLGSGTVLLAVKNCRSIMTAEDLRYVNMSGKDKMNDKGKAKYSL